VLADSRRYKHRASTPRTRIAPDAASPTYDYVMCRDGPAAVRSVRSCAQHMREGKPCGLPHTIQLIMPASAIGLALDEHVNDLAPASAIHRSGRATSHSHLHVGDIANDEPLVEVHCHVMAVGRIPSSGSKRAPTPNPLSPSAVYGRVVSTVSEAGSRLP
jgi:hypothetical protein